MKKVVLFISFLMIALSFSSCKKEDVDGVYDPKKKIDRIYKENFNAKIIYLALDTIEISSSEIRNAVINNEDLTKYLSFEIIEYINQNSLYLEK